MFETGDDSLEDSAVERTVEVAVDDAEDDVENDTGVVIVGYILTNCVEDVEDGVEGVEGVEDNVEGFVKAAKYPLRNCNGSCDCC